MISPASTADRVPENTSVAANKGINRATYERIRFCAEHPEEIDDRLDGLDREWDIERVLAGAAASLTLLGLAMGVARDRRMLILPGVVAAFLLQHTLQGWSPPLEVVRMMGVRTAREIGIERSALKFLRGDFEATPGIEPGMSPEQRAGVAMHVAFMR